MGREFELKYAADAAALAALQVRFPDLCSIAMETTYYDTPDRFLSSLRWTLCRRMENGVSVCTLKTPLPDGSRGEWEVCCGSIEEGIRMLSRSGAPEALLHHTAAGVEEVCGARFDRLAGPIKGDGFTAELALDRGMLLGGGRERPFMEVEVELKSGSDQAAAQFARQLADEFGLKDEPKSKYRRALDLAKGER